jgi:ParB/RepB/Spo0J family partition protein
MNELTISKLTGHKGAKPPAALVKSMKDQGFLPAFPIIVTPLPEGIYKILDGRRRAAAAEQADLETVWAVTSDKGAPLTILAHATRSENPVAELRAYQELMHEGMSEKQIAGAGYASLQRIRRIAKLNQLIPEIAMLVDNGQIAPSVAFQITGLAPEIQYELAKEEKITGPVVKEYQSVQRQKAKLSVPGLEEVFDIRPQATIEDVFEAISNETLQALLDEIPLGDRFSTWRAKIRKKLSTPTGIAVELTLPAEQAI